MTRKTFRLEVYAFGERNQAIENCRASLLSSGGDILDFKMFSDMLVNFIVEIPEKNLSKLQLALEDLKCKTELEIVGGLDDSLQVIQGTMSVTLASGVGDRKDVIPAVPG